MRELAWVNPATLHRLRAVLLYGDKFVAGTLLGPIHNPTVVALAPLRVAVSLVPKRSAVPLDPERIVEEAP